MEVDEREGKPMCSLSIHIPDPVLTTLHMNKEEAQSFANQMVALALFKEKNVPLEMCAQIAGMSNDEFASYSLEGTLSSEEVVNEVFATMAMEGMPLSEEERDMLRDLHAGKVTGDELRQRIIASVMEKAAG